MIKLIWLTLATIATLAAIEHFTGTQTPGIVLPSRQATGVASRQSDTPKPAPAIVTPYRLTLQVATNRAAAEGAVPNEATREALLDMLSQRASAGPIEADLHVDAALSADLAAMILAIVTELLALPQADAELTHTLITISGRVESLLQREQVTAAIRPVIPFGVALSLNLDLPSAIATTRLTKPD